MARVIVKLDAGEREALWILAQHEKRDIRQQAALLIRHGLERLGLLPTNETGLPTTLSGHMIEAEHDNIQ